MATIEPNFESICIDPNDDLVLYKKEIVRSRIEKFLYAICSLDNDDLPTPLSRIEEMYKCLVTGVDFITFTPLSRAEKFVMAMLGAYDVELLPTPISRSETLMKKIATGDTNLDDVDNLQSRYEFLLAYIIKAGGFNGGSGDFYYDLISLTSSFTTIYGTLDKPVKNAVLKGQTLVNLVKKLTDENIGNGNKTWQIQGSGQATYSYNVDKGVTLSNAVNGSMVLNYVDLTLFKPNTEYTLFIDVNWNGVGIIPHFTKLTTKEIQLNNGLNIIKFTTISDLTVQNACLRLGYAGTIAVGCEYTFNNIMVLEGDWTNVDIPYFEGMASVKMPVLTTVGKNLYSYGDLTINNPVPNAWYYTNGKGASFGSSCKRTDGGNWFYLEKGVYNYKSINENAQTNIILVGEGEKLYDPGKEVPSGWYVFRIKSMKESVDYMKISQLQLEKDSTATSYEPFKSNILTCNEEVELRGIGDIKDELNLVTGEYTKAIYEYTFTGNEHWEIGGSSGGYTYFQCKLNQLPINYKYTTDANIPIYCNRLPVITYNDFDSKLKNVGINLTYFFRLNFSDCDSNNGATVEDLKAYLKTNPTTIQYPISKSVTTVDLSTLDQDNKETKLTTFDDITHVTVSSEGLVPTGDIDIARPIQFVDYSLDNSLTTLYNTFERPVKNAVLKGQTLVNMSSLTGVTTLKPGDVIFIENAGMKINTTYTIMFNCSNVPSTNFVEIKTMMDNTQITQVQQNVSVRYNKFTIRTHTSKETNRFRFKNDTSSSTDFIFSELLILEGDYTNEDIPYFEGMASVKMPVLTTTGKNLVGKLVYGSVAHGGKIADNKGQLRVRTDYINIQNEENITIKTHSEEVNCSISFFYDENKNFISQTSWGTNITNSNGVTISIPLNTKYIICEFSHNLPSDKDLVLSNIKVQIEKGDTATFYESFKSNILTCNEEVELRGIGDIKDELNLTTGELTQRIGEFVFDGSSDELWFITTNNSGLKRFVSDVKKTHTNYSEITNWLPTANKTYWTINENGFYIGTNGSPVIVFNTNDSRYNMSITELENYLSQNPLIVQYPLAEETIKTVTLSISDQDDVLLILENGEYIITENGDYIKVGIEGEKTKLKTFDDIINVTVSSEGLVPTGEITVATKNATDVIDASVMSLRMDDILNSQGTLEGSANTQSDDIDVAMLGTTDIYEQLL